MIWSSTRVGAYGPLAGYPALPLEHNQFADTFLLPPTLTWRGLFVLGLAGGLIPSTSALIILLGSIAAGRPAFGVRSLSALPN